MSRFANSLLLGVLMATWLTSALPIMGQSPTQRVIRPQRLVQVFDFEETDDVGVKLGYGHELPRHWYAIGRSPRTADPTFTRQPLHRELIQRPAFPSFTDVRYDRQQTRSGDFSLLVSLNGGNAGAYLEVGALPAVPGSDYVITAKVFTQNLQRANARLVAYFVDGRGRRIDESVRYSSLLDTQGQWMPVSVKLPGIFQRAAWIGVEVQLLQPQPDPKNPLGKQQIVLQDVQGNAWFDDIGIWQVPHLEIATQTPVNVVRAPTQPQLSMNVRDLTAQALEAELSVYDVQMNLIDRQQWQVGMGAPMRWDWTPDLGKFGWFLVDMKVRDIQTSGQPGQVTARTLGAFLWMPPEHALHPSDAARFAILAEGLPDEQLRLVPELLERTGVERTVVSAWGTRTTRTSLDRRLELLDAVLERLLLAGKDMSISLYPLPDELAETQGIETRQPLEMLQGPREAWMPYLSPVLVRHSQRVRHWWLGQVGADDSAFGRSDLLPTLQRVVDDFRQLAPHPQLLLPWRVIYPRERGVGEHVGFAVDVGPEVSAQGLPGALAEWVSPPAMFWLCLRERPATEMSHSRRATNLALRMVEAWAADPTGLSVHQPWTVSGERRTAVLPDPLLGVFSNVACQLSGRRMVGVLPIGEGLQARIFDGPHGGMLVIWNEHAPPSDAVVNMYLGERPVLVDVWGNRTPLPQRDGKNHLTVTRSPLFIEGIDAELALFRAGFKLVPPMIESRQVPHARHLVLTNPWPRTISGHLQITGPKGWQIQPSRHPFSIASGQRAELPINMQFSVAEAAGGKRLEARFDFTADQHYKIDMSTPFEVGLSDVEFDATVSIEPGDTPDAEDVVVVCIVTNKSDKEAAMYVFASLVGHPRQERIIARLGAGQSVVHRFRFKNAGREVRQYPVRTGIRETNGPAILNKLLQPQAIAP